MQFVKSPNLPQNSTKLAAVGNYPPVIDALRSLGTEIFIIQDNPDIQAPVKSHADMSLLHLGENKFLSYNDEVNDYLRILGAEINKPSIVQNASYPQDIGLNCLFIDSFTVCNTRYSASEIIDFNNSSNRKVIHVQQGYARCATAVVDEKSIITADSGIAVKMSGENFDVLLINEGNIQLPGYEYGFIGGCCGKISKNQMLFYGNPLKHPDGERIVDFIHKREIDIIAVGNTELIDFGGIIQIME